MDRDLVLERLGLTSLQPAAVAQYNNAGDDFNFVSYSEAGPVTKGTQCDIPRLFARYHIEREFACRMERVRDSAATAM
jgi:hypothetical protein